MNSDQPTKDDEIIVDMGDSWPPNILEAEIHTQANIFGMYDTNDQQRVKDLNDGSAEFCKCCGMIVQKGQLYTCSDQLNSIETIGISTLLFFQFLKQVCFFMLSNFIIYGIYSIATNVNLTSSSASDYITTCLKSSNCSLVVQIGLSSKMADTPPVTLQIQAWLGLAMTIIWIFQLLYIRKRFYSIGQLLEQKLISPSDFTAMLYGLPVSEQEQMSEQQIRKQLMDWHAGTQSNLQFKIEKINVAYQIQQFSQLKQKLVNQLTKKRKVRICKKVNKEVPDSISQEEINQLQPNIQKYMKELQEMTENADGTKLRTGLYAFVTFSTKLQLYAFINRTRKSLFAQYFLDNFDKLLCCGNVRNQLKIGGKFIKTVIAPQPLDINWQNCGVSKSQLFVNKIISYILSLLFLGASFGIIYGLSLAQAGYKGDSQLILSLVISVVVLIINKVLLFILNKFTILQKSFTKSGFYESLAVKTILAQLMNSILVLVIVAYFIKQRLNNIKVYQRSGLTEDCFMLSLTTSFLPFFMSFFVDIELILQKYNRCSIEGDIQKNQCTLTQIEVNKALQNPHFYISAQYVTVCVIVIYNAFFACLQPICCLFGFAGLALYYYTKKYLLYNRYSRPEQLGKSINESMNSLIDFAPFVFSFGSLVVMNFFKNVQPSTFIPNIIAVGISGLNIILPLQSIYHFFLSKTFQGQSDSKSYQESRILFFDEYDRSNPVTRNKALEEWLKFLQSRSDNKQAIATVKQLVNNNRQGEKKNSFVNNIPMPMGMQGTPMPFRVPSFNNPFTNPYVKSPSNFMPQYPNMMPQYPQMRPQYPQMRPQYAFNPNMQRPQPPPPPPTFPTGPTGQPQQPYVQVPQRMPQIPVPQINMQPQYPPQPNLYPPNAYPQPNLYPQPNQYPQRPPVNPFAKY